jgi:hypothetical protein
MGQTVPTDASVSNVADDRLPSKAFALGEGPGEGVGAGQAPVGQAVGMAFPKPSRVVPRDERELLLRFLNRQRADVVAVAEGLSDEQARWTPDGALVPIVGLINHLTHVEWRWVEGRYLGRPFPERTDEFAAPGIGLEAARGAYWEQAQRTDEIVRCAPSLEVACLGREGDRPPAHTLLGLDEPLDLRWVVLHLIEETAHHAGHADATRELLDGKLMRP